MAMKQLEKEEDRALAKKVADYFEGAFDYRRALLGVTLFVLGTACGGDPGGSTMPKRYNVQITGAMVAPSMTNGDQWDGSGTIDPAEKQKFLDALGKVPTYGAYLELAAIVADAVNAGTAAPDPYGYAELAQSGTYQSDLRFSFFADVNSNLEDTYVPNFPLPNGWTDLKIDEGTRVRVTLLDEDLVNDDPIGVAEISSSELLAAASEGKVHHVRVDDQTQRQLVYIDVSVQTITQ